MNPLIVLLGLLTASTFSVLFVMRREKIKVLTSWVTVVVVVLGIPIMTFIFIGLMSRLAAM